MQFINKIKKSYGFFFSYGEHHNVINHKQVRFYDASVFYGGFSRNIFHFQYFHQLKEGREEGKAEVVRNLVTKMGLTDAQAADIAEVSADFGKKVRRKLK